MTVLGASDLSTPALATFSQGLEQQPVDQRIIGSIPGQEHIPGLQVPQPQESAFGKQPINGCVSVSHFSPLSLPSCLPSTPSRDHWKKISSGKDDHLIIPTVFVRGMSEPVQGKYSIRHSNVKQFPWHSNAVEYSCCKGGYTMFKTDLKIAVKFSQAFIR